MRNSVEGGDDVRVVEAGGRTGLAAEPLDEASVAIERWREDLGRDSAPEQTVVSLVHVGHPPTADLFPERRGPSRTAVVPATMRPYPGSGPSMPERSWTPPGSAAAADAFECSARRSRGQGRATTSAAWSELLRRGHIAQAHPDERIRCAITLHWAISREPVGPHRPRRERRSSTLRTRARRGFQPAVWTRASRKRSTSVASL